MYNKFFGKINRNLRTCSQINRNIELTEQVERHEEKQLISMLVVMARQAKLEVYLLVVRLVVV